MNNIKQFIDKNKYIIIICLVFIIGFSVRLIGIDKIPYGFNQDEASAGYEAYSILKFGMDRNGKIIPVHFISWGSGQNVLYSYIMIPFVAILGLNVLAVRLPMAIAGCISLIVIYFLFKQYGKKITIIGLAFFAICPWHIMKSRWGLEANIFPDLVLWATYIMINSIKSNKISIFYIGISLLSLSVYSYGTSYMFLPIYIISILIYLLKTKKIKIKNAIISIIISTIIAFPIMLFVIINTFDLNEIKIGFITIPRVYQNRYETVTTIFSSNFFISLKENFLNNLMIFIKQNDGMIYNSIPYIGITYIVSVPFLLIGLYNSIKNRNLEKNFLNLWFITSFLLMLVMKDSNINRLNICIIPLIIYTIFGIYYVIKNNNFVFICIVIVYMVSFILFGKNYLILHGKNGKIFEHDLEEPLKYISNLDVEYVYIKKSFTQPYIYTLFYTQSSTNNFLETVKYNSQKVAFEDIKSYGKYMFYLPSDTTQSNVAYLIPNDYTFSIDKEIYQEVNFRKYKVLVIKDNN